MKQPQAVLFDLDGTLVDTAPDLVYALNCLRKEHGLTELPLAAIRPLISHGSKPMVKHVLDIDETNPHFMKSRERFLELYQLHLANATQLFPNIAEILSHLDEQQIPWGIVTNKLTRHTMPLLKALNLADRAACIICGDTLSTFKPDPAPILYACELLKKIPEHCFYIGDSITDVAASKAAGTKTFVALYGYIGHEENPYDWQADGYFHEPAEMMKLFMPSF